jgi:hypothetical protein
MLPVRAANNGFGDLARFLAGWVLLPPESVKGDPTAYDPITITFDDVSAMLSVMKEDDFWNSFPDALITVINNQFAPQFLQLEKGKDEPLAVMASWPDSVFTYRSAAGNITTPKAVVMSYDKPTAADRAAFVDYCRHLITGVLSEMRMLIQDTGTIEGAATEASAGNPPDSRRSLKWSQIWDGLLATLN